MSHIAHDKNRLEKRLCRLIGQLEGIRRMVQGAFAGDDTTCYKVMQQLAAARGAITSLMAEVIDEHIEYHVVRVESPHKRREGANELLRVLRSFQR